MGEKASEKGMQLGALPVNQERRATHECYLEQNQIVINKTSPRLRLIATGEEPCNGIVPSAKPYGYSISKASHCSLPSRSICNTTEAFGLISPITERNPSMESMPVLFTV